MPISVSRAARLVRRAQLPFEEHVQDPRAPSGVRHRLGGMLSVAVAALSCLKHTPRQMEEVSKDLTPKMRRRLGINRKRVSDTAIYELVAALRADQFREVVGVQIRADLESKAIRNDLFPAGVLTFDGKGAGSGMGDSPTELCRQSVCDDQGTKCWDAFALRACLTSSTARPLLDQQYILRKANEASTFPEMFGRLVVRYPKLFRYVTWDAGLTCRRNTQLVRDSGKHYVGAIKANFNKLFPLAKQLLEDSPVVSATEEQAQGKHVRRELRRVSAPDGFALADMTELWGVRQISTDKDGNVETDDRVFAVSIPSDELTDDHRLALVRQHWGIENGANWTADLLLREDTRTPCTAGEGVLVIGWLRLLAYNILAVFRAHLPLKDRRPESWKRSGDLVYQAFLMLDYLLLAKEHPSSL